MNKVKWEKIKYTGSILVYYDSPQLIYWKNYLCLLVDTDKWIVTSHSSDDIENFLTGKIDLLETIKDKSLGKWVILDTCEYIEIRKIDNPQEEFLPNSGFYYGK